VMNWRCCTVPPGDAFPSPKTRLWLKSAICRVWVENTQEPETTMTTILAATGSPEKLPLITIPAQ